MRGQNGEEQLVALDQAEQKAVRRRVPWASVVLALRLHHIPHASGIKYERGVSLASHTKHSIWLGIIDSVVDRRLGLDGAGRPARRRWRPAQQQGSRSHQ